MSLFWGKCIIFFCYHWFFLYGSMHYIFIVMFGLFFLSAWVDFSQVFVGALCRSACTRLVYLALGLSHRSC